MMDDAVKFLHLTILECLIVEHLNLILTVLITAIPPSNKCHCLSQGFHLLIQDIAAVAGEEKFQALDMKVGLLIFWVHWNGMAYLIIGHNSKAKYVNCSHMKVWTLIWL